MRKNYTEEQIAEIIKLYQEGITPKDIGLKFGIYNNSVTRILRKRGIERTQCVRINEDRQKIIIERYVSGESSERIAKDLEIDGTTVCRILKRNNIEIRPSEENKRKYKIDKYFFETIDCEAKAYFLGFMYADGNVHKRLGNFRILIRDIDKPILEKLSEMIYGKNMVKISVDGNRPDKSNATLYVYSIKVVQDLIKHGCMPNKTFKIRLPVFNDYLMKHFIRGYFDGDGCLHIKNRRIVFDITSNYEFICQLSDFFEERLDIKVRKYRHYKNNESGNLQIGKFSYLRKVLSYLFEDSTIYLDRKFESYLHAKEILSTVSRHEKKLK